VSGAACPVRRRLRGPGWCDVLVLAHVCDLPAHCDDEEDDEVDEEDGPEDWDVEEREQGGDRREHHSPRGGVPANEVPCEHERHWIKP